MCVYFAKIHCRHRNNFFQISFLVLCLGRVGMGMGWTSCSGIPSPQLQPRASCIASFASVLEIMISQKEKKNRLLGEPGINYDFYTSKNVIYTWYLDCADLLPLLPIIYGSTRLQSSMLPQTYFSRNL